MQYFHHSGHKVEQREQEVLLIQSLCAYLLTYVQLDTSAHKYSEN